ncbi:hypothetical protein J3F84DRAFT_404920 [Trichoderma pleuroticola]
MDVFLVFSRTAAHAQLNDNIDTERIMDSLCAHISFHVKEGYEMKNLPKFDDLTRYNIREEEEHKLWKLEVERLAHSARSNVLPTLEGNLEWFGETDSEGYNRLNRLARQILYGIDICEHDNELLLLESYPQLAHEDSYKMVHRKINGIFDEEQGSIRYERPIRIEQFNDEALHALINYVTAVLIRLLVRSMSGRFWIDNCISVLAKFAAKSKVVAANFPLAFERTLEAHKEFQIRVSQNPDSQGFVQGSQSNSLGSDDGPLAKQQKVLQEDFDISGARYFIEMDAFRTGIHGLMQTILADLIWNEESAETADMFETSSTIYDTGFRDKRTHLCHERDGSIGVATERRAIDFAGLAFQIGIDIWNTLPSNGPRTDCSTALVWSRTPLYDNGLENDGNLDDIERERSEIHLTAMMDAIKGLVPFVMYCGSFASRLSMFTELANLISDPSAPVQYYQQRKFITVAKINTSAYEKNIAAKKTVFQTDMAKKAQRGKPNNQLKDKVEQAEKWTIDEKSIVIDHTWYSLASLSACALLIAGGMALVAIQDKAPGVDPSSLTALAWAASGFLMVYLKSRKVQDWPWRDFLRGNIVCRSISEVNSVTGMDPQTLMAILLRLESRVILKTCGPFNTLFSKKAEDGFSIDVPPLTNTVIDGGYIFIRVDSMSGPALVSLRANSRGLYNSIIPKDSCVEEETYTCQDFEDFSHYVIDEEPLPLYPLCTNELRWYKVRGVFSGKACFS